MAMRKDESENDKRPASLANLKKSLRTLVRPHHLRALVGAKKWHRLVAVREWASIILFPSLMKLIYHFSLQTYSQFQALVKMRSQHSR